MRKRHSVAPFLLACLTLPASAQLEDSRQNYPTADAGLGEHIGETEVDDVMALIETISEKIRTQYTPGEARRDAHPKAHGCVRATFTVDQTLPEHLRAGLFQPGAKYESVIRFSNGAPNPEAPDYKPDTRGMAIRLSGVPGEKLVPDPAAPDAQDFILMSAPFFFMNDAHRYSEFVEVFNSDSKYAWMQLPFILGWRGTINAYHMLSQTIAHPIYTPYFSITPYQFGEGDARQAVKYSARPCDQTPRAMPANPGPNFLREAMKDSLSKGSVCMAFMVQPNQGTDYTVEDVMTEWDETVAPFVHVAEIDIHQQDFDTAPQNAACESMGFNPWHALPAHKPLGAINRLRRAVYQAIDKLRNEMNGPH